MHKYHFSDIGARPVKCSFYDSDNVGVRFDAELKLEKDKVMCTGQVYGIIKHRCDICASDINLNINENIKLVLFDGVYNDLEHLNIDVYECMDGVIDLDEILKSEIESFKSDYFYCDNCKITN